MIGDGPLETFKALNFKPYSGLGWATVRLPVKEFKVVDDLKGDMGLPLKMTNFSTPCILINLHHSKSASVVLTRSMVSLQICIVIILIQELWMVRGAITGLISCSKVFRVNTADKTRACIITKCSDVTLLPQLICGDLAAAQLRLKVASGQDRDMVVGSV
jgi:hypothetical protein